MNRSRVGKALLALLALVAVAAGATGGRAATLALRRAIGVAGDSVAEMQTEPRFRNLPLDSRTNAE